MSKFDINTMTFDKTPSRWIMSAARLREMSVEELDKLHPNEREIFDKLYESDWGTSRPAYTTASVVSADASDIVFAISSSDDDNPITFDMSVASGEYGTSPAAPTDATGDITVSGGQWTYGSSAAGSEFKFAFAATDSDGVEGPIKSIEVIIAPATPADLAIGLDGAVTFSAFGAASFAVTYTVAANDPVTATMVSGAIIPHTSGEDISATVVATNPGGSSAASAEVGPVTTTS